jgi:predicted nucleotidyltransferase
VLAALRRRHDLDLAGALKEEDHRPALRSRLANRQRAVVPQHHRVLVAEIGTSRSRSSRSSAMPS